MEWMTWVHGRVPSERTERFRAGDEVRVWFKILEQGKERLGQFEGTVIRCHGAGPSRTFTVRRITHGEGVERVFPFDSKTVSRIEVLRPGRVKRARLYYLRTAVGKTRIAADQSGKDRADGESVTPAPQGIETAAAAPEAGLAPKS